MTIVFIQVPICAPTNCWRQQIHANLIFHMNTEKNKHSPTHPHWVGTINWPQYEETRSKHQQNRKWMHKQSATVSLCEYVSVYEHQKIYTNNTKTNDTFVLGHFLSAQSHLLIQFHSAAYVWNYCRNKKNRKGFIKVGNYDYLYVWDTTWQTKKSRSCVGGDG